MYSPSRATYNREVITVGKSNYFIQYDNLWELMVLTEQPEEEGGFEWPNRAVVERLSCPAVTLRAMGSCPLLAPYSMQP